jgi:hypothetical protein
VDRGWGREGTGLECEGFKMSMAKRIMDDEDGEGLPLSRATYQHSSRWSRRMLDGKGDMDQEGLGMR